MHRVAIGLALGFSLLGCAPNGEQVPLVTVEGQTCCLLSYSIVDVVASSVQEMRWPVGYTAWRVGSEVEVRDPSGWVVLTTPGRYRISPTWPDWAVGEVEPCSGCELGGGPE